MARLKGNVIGNFCGRLGNLSVRVVAGRTILAARPSSYNVNYSPSAVLVRKKFSVASKLGKFILSLPALEVIWKSVKEETLSAFNTILKNNFKLVSADKPTVDNIITPGGFSLPVSTASVDADKITASISELNTKTVFTPEEVNLSANAVVCFTDPVNPDDEPYQIIACSKEIENYNFDQAYELQIDLDVRQQLIAAKYTKKILLLSVASKTADGLIVQYSATSPKAI